MDTDNELTLLYFQCVLIVSMFGKVKRFEWRKRDRERGKKEMPKSMIYSLNSDANKNYVIVS